MCVCVCVCVCVFVCARVYVCVRVCFYFSFEFVCYGSQAKAIIDFWLNITVRNETVQTVVS